MSTVESKIKEYERRIRIMRVFEQSNGRREVLFCLRSAYARREHEWEAASTPTWEWDRFIYKLTPMRVFFNVHKMDDGRLILSDEPYDSVDEAEAEATDCVVGRVRVEYDEEVYDG